MPVTAVVYRAPSTTTFGPKPHRAPVSPSGSNARVTSTPARVSSETTTWSCSRGLGKVSRRVLVRTGSKWAMASPENTTACVVPCARTIALVGASFPSVVPTTRRPLTPGGAPT